MSEYKLDMEKYASLAREAVAEGCVLLRNEEKALPLRKNERIAVYGRIASTYYKSGLGSGGMVNTSYVVGILDALFAETDIVVEKKVREIYDAWTKENPFDEGSGWGKVPWSQKEMPVTRELLEAGAGCDAAIVVLGRTAGEDQDNRNDEGSYLLTKEERALLEAVCKNNKRTIVVLNVGNIIDMSWVEEYKPQAVLYVWQGGQEGGNGIADVLMGRISPSGKLTDTIAYALSEYPSNEQFGHPDKNYYEEDIYVGYRYFETFAKDKVMYPFGFGLSYTSFDIDAQVIETSKDSLTVEAQVKNLGKASGKEVVQIYVSAPQGKLGKPSMVLAGFAKTSCIKPQETEHIKLVIPKENYASYDDSGETGHKSAFVLEAGDYHVFAGNSVRDVKEIAILSQEFMVVRACEECLAPVEVFTRIKPVEAEGMLRVAKEAVPLRTIAPMKKREAQSLYEVEYTGDKGYKLKDVYNKEITMDEFVAQLSNEDLMTLMRGEGMCSPKVTPGTAAAFGGISESLRAFGIPALCATDGPSGIRMDCGTKAFSLPNGTLLGCTFNLPLVQELYTMTGRELRQNRIDTLLGPGINIHRHPLNGRNFEYISEDPLLTGKMAVAQLLGLQAFSSSGTIKHFSTNNQEAKRHFVNAVVSERALREIYLKVFEIAVKEADCRSIMTTYGPLNGLWTAGSYDLNTSVLRKEWGFEGIVMTDWWAAANDEGKESDRTNRAAMVMAQNDVVMVTQDASDEEQDNIKSALEEGKISRAELVRNAKNILQFALKSVAMQYEMELITEEELKERKAVAENEAFAPDELEYFAIDSASDELIIDATNWDTSKGSQIVFGIVLEKVGLYDVSFTVSSELSELAQIPVSVYRNNTIHFTHNFRGTAGNEITETKDFGFSHGGQQYIKVFFGANGLKVKQMKISFREEVNFTKLLES